MEVGTDVRTFLKCSEMIKTNFLALGAGWKDVTGIFLSY